MQRTKDGFEMFTYNVTEISVMSSQDIMTHMIFALGNMLLAATAYTTQCAELNL